MAELFAALIIALGTVGAALLVGIVGLLFRGWVLTKLWTWFVVTGFGLAPISLPLAIGLSLLVD